MRCPECYLENEAHAKQCVKCGADLTQAAFVESPSQRSSQVWSKEIDSDRNQKNSRTAFAVLGVTVLLVIALVVSVCLYLPKVMSYSMDSMDLELPDFSLSEVIDSLREIEIISREAVAPEPEPDYPPADIVGAADSFFFDAFESYVLKLKGAGNEQWQRGIHQEFLPKFEHLCMQEYDSDRMYEYVCKVTELARVLGNAETERVEYLQALHELSGVVLLFNGDFYFLPDNPEVLKYWISKEGHTQAELEVECVLREQLIDAKTVWHKDYGCQAVYFTNNSKYKITFTCKY